MLISTMKPARKNRLSRVTLALLTISGTLFASGCLMRNDLGQAFRSAAASDVSTGLNAILDEDQDGAAAAFGNAIVDGLVELYTPES